MNNFKIALITLCVLSFPSLSFCLDLGGIKIMLPGPGLLIKADTISIDAEGREYANILIEPGYHKIKLELVNGTTLYDGTVKVNAGNTTTVWPEISDETIKKLYPSSSKEYFAKREDAEMTDSDYFPGQYGIGLGMDGADVPGILSVLCGKSIFSASTKGYSSLLDLFYFNNWKICNKWYADFHVGVMEGAIPEEDRVGLSAGYFDFGVKYKINRFFMVGVRPGFSLWSLSTSKSKPSSSPELRLFFDVVPISSEIGIVVRSISAGEDAVPKSNMLTSGFYYKYKVNL